MQRKEATQLITNKSMGVTVSNHRKKLYYMAPSGGLICEGVENIPESDQVSKLTQQYPSRDTMRPNSVLDDVGASLCRLLALSKCQTVSSQERP